MRLIGRDDLAVDPRMADNAGRVEHVDELDGAIGRWAGAQRLEEVLQALKRADVPSGPIFTAADIAEDPHYLARGMRERHPVRIKAGEEKEVAFPGIVPKLENAPGRTEWLGPELGCHTASVLAEIGVAADALAELREQGVI
jgi:formyl-CoA transferase